MDSFRSLADESYNRIEDYLEALLNTGPPTITSYDHSFNVFGGGRDELSCVIIDLWQWTNPQYIAAVRREFVNYYIRSAVTFLQFNPPHKVKKLPSLSSYLKAYNHYRDLEALAVIKNSTFPQFATSSSLSSAFPTSSTLTETAKTELLNNQQFRRIYNQREYAWRCRRNVDNAFDKCMEKIKKILNQHVENLPDSYMNGELLNVLDIATMSIGNSTMNVLNAMYKKLK